MADSPTRGPRGRRGRVASSSSRASAASSARSSAVFDSGSSSGGGVYYGDYLHPSAGYQPYPAHGLRPAESRFSLNEQFAATRREIEFGYDDASSILERSTLASASDATAPDDTIRLGSGAGGDYESLVVVDRPAGPGGVLSPLHRTHYELLCLPSGEPGAAPLSPAQIRRAYFRLFDLLHTDKLPAQYHSVAGVYFSEVQVAFETLIEPARRAAYDAAIQELASELSDTDEELEGEDNRLSSGDGGGSAENLDLRRREWLMRMREKEYQEALDMGVRFDLFRILEQRPTRNTPYHAAPKPLDFSLTKSLTVDLPSLGFWIEDRVRTIQQAFIDPSAPRKLDQYRVRFGVPTVTVSACAYGKLEERLRPAIILASDEYQPLLGAVIPRNRLLRPVPVRLLPFATVKLRQELFFGPSGPERQLALPDAVVELETDSLRDASVTARASRTIYVQGDAEPLHVEASVTAARRRSWARDGPRLGLAMHRRAGRGTLFACADSGGWWATTFGQAEECRHLSNFSRLARKSFSDGISQLSDPTVELGYKFSLDDMGLAACQALTKQAESGIRRLDRDVDVSGPEPSWTVSTALTPRSVAGYLRYGRDVSLPGQTTVGKTSGATKSNPLRVELELCAARFRSSGYLALRALRRIGASSKLGLEVSLAPTTTADVHLSLYWSRRNGQQRLVVPFLATSFTTASSSPSFLSPTIVFLAALVPLAGLTAVELLLQWRRKTKAEEKERAKARGKSSSSRDELLQDRVARRRAEADELTALLAGPVAARQGAQRRKGGLVILSAKYGVRDDSSSPSGAPGTATSGGWAADVEEVADVTVAVAALVDDEGVLLIPRGVRKARLLGFWDPAPGRAKTLVVRYSHLRSEGIVEVKGSGELRLP